VKLTDISFLPTVGDGMRIRPISLALLFLLSGGAVTGVPTPMDAGTSSCPMEGTMSGMDCCKAALGQGTLMEIASARVCCALNCPQSGTTGPQGFKLNRTAQILLLALHPPQMELPVATPPIGPHSSRNHSPPQYSNPSYIRNLSLLI